MSKPVINPSKEAKSNLFSRLRNWLLSLDIIKRLGRTLIAIKDFLYENTRTSFWIFIAFILFTVIGVYTHNITMITLSGLLWMSICLAFFSLTVFIDKGVKTVASLLIDEKLKNNSSDVTNIDTQKSKPDQILDIVFSVTSKLIFTTAGIIIAITHLITNFHIRSAVKIDDPFLTKDLASWVSWLFVIGAPIIGRISDMIGVKEKNLSVDDIDPHKQKISYKGGLILALGIIQFYGSFMILLTGLIGGEMAMLAINTILHKPHYLVADVIGYEYLQSYSHTIYAGIGNFWFIVIYLIYPATFAMLAHVYLGEIRKGKTKTMPKSSLESLRIVSLVLLFIGLIVSWNEGWIGNLILMLANFVKYIINLFR